MADPDLCGQCGNQLPAGQLCGQCQTAPESLEAILRASQGITPDMGGAVRATAQIHADWRDAWTATGRFSDEETFELVRIIVAASAGGIGALG
jgi:hypothetical protein